MVAIETMGERRFSQMPVYGADGYLGLLTTNGVARWLGAHAEADGALLVDEPCVGAILDWAEEYEVARFVARDASVASVIDLLSAPDRVSQSATAAVIATYSGRPSESPLAVLVVHDLPELLAALHGDLATDVR